MRIAEIAPLFVRVPPERYGGTERVVHALTEELVRRGHRVTLFAPATSMTSAELHISAPMPLWEIRAADPFAYRILQIEEVVRRSREFDIIHSHVEYLPWMARNRIQAPIITSLHGRLDCLEHQALFAYNQEQPVVSISDAQRRPLEHLDMNWVATVHNGLPLASLYSLGDGDGGYLAYIGRVAPEKDTGGRDPRRGARRYTTQDRRQGCLAGRGLLSRLRAAAAAASTGPLVGRARRRREESSIG